MAAALAQPTTYGCSPALLLSIKAAPSSAAAVAARSKNAPGESSVVTDVVVHPIVLLSVLDHHTRRQEGAGRVIGTLLGKRDGDRVSFFEWPNPFQRFSSMKEGGEHIICINTTFLLCSQGMKIEPFFANFNTDKTSFIIANIFRLKSPTHLQCHTLSVVMKLPSAKTLTVKCLLFTSARTLARLSWVGMPPPSPMKMIPTENRNVLLIRVH
jgi:hypothetical protein